MLCSTCGRTAADGHTFCVYCGGRIVGDTTVRIDDGALREAKDALRKSIKRRGQTDRKIPPQLVIVTTVVIISIAIAIVIVSLITAFDSYDRFSESDDISSTYDIYAKPEIIILLLLSLMAEAVLAKISFDLVSRQTKHFDREKDLRAALSPLVDPYHGRWDGYNILPHNAERRRVPLFWFFVVIGSSATSLAFLPIIGNFTDSGAFLLSLILLCVLAVACYILRLYMLCFLTKEMRDHHRRWYEFTLEVKRQLARSGYVAGHLHTPDPIPTRDNAVYVVVTIFFSPFIYYWWYAVVKDCNLHFDEQRRFEDGLLKLLETRPRPQSPPAAVTAQA